jgi:hypothetical protein
MQISQIKQADKSRCAEETQRLERVPGPLPEGAMALDPETPGAPATGGGIRLVPVFVNLCNLRNLRIVW